MDVCLIMLKCERFGCSESSFIVFLNQLSAPTDPDALWMFRHGLSLPAVNFPQCLLSFETAGRWRLLGLPFWMQEAASALTKHTPTHTFSKDVCVCVCVLVYSCVSHVNKFPAI